MSAERDMRIDGEYDRPLPPVNPTPSKEDLAKLQSIIEKYTRKPEEDKADDGDGIAMKGV